MKIPALLLACALSGGMAMAQTTPATPATPATAATPAAASVKADASASVTTEKATKKTTAKAKTTTKAKAKTKKSTTQTMGAGAMAPVTDLQAPAREARINEAYARWQASAR